VRRSWRSIGRAALRWAFVLGGAGFAAGFFGPMVLDPESNIGPIIGILFSGPGGFLIGLAAGALFALLPVPRAAQRAVLVLGSIALVLATLWFCLPEPAVRGYVIEARIEACERPSARLDAALAGWQAEVRRVTWAKPSSPDWQAIATETVRRDPGVVLTLRIERKRPIYRHRRPWDRGESSAGAWSAANESKAYYADDEGASCTAYLARPRMLYWPEIDPDFDPTKPAKTWPPTDTLGFLSLQRLGPVPLEYRRLLDAS